MGIAQDIGLGGSDRVTGYPDIAAWCEAGINLSLWERETVHSLSGTFVSALNKYRTQEGKDDEHMMPPWMPDGAREKIQKQREMLAAMTKPAEPI